MLPDLLAAVIERAVGPGGEAIRDAAVLRVHSPELALDVRALVVDAMDVGHANGEPGGDPVLPCAGDPARIDIDAGLIQRPRRVNPLPRADPLLWREASEQRLIVRGERIVP